MNEEVKHTTPEEVVEAADMPDTNTANVPAEDGAVQEAENTEPTVETAPENTPEQDRLTPEPREEKKDGPVQDGVPDAESPKKERRSFKEIWNGIKNNKIIGQVYHIVLLVLTLAAPLLCLLQIALWGLTVAGTYKAYLAVITGLDFIGITIMVLMLIFLITIAVTAVKNLLLPLQKRQEIHFESVASLFAFYCFTLLVCELFADRAFLVSDFSYGPLATVIAVLVLVYALLRLFSRDFGSRIAGIAISCVSVAVLLALYFASAGSFITVSGLSADAINPADLNLVRYITSFSSSDPQSQEYLFAMGTLTGNGEVADAKGFMILLLQFVLIFAANILPLAAFSFVGYMIYGLVSKNYVQFYKLKACNRAAISMLIVSVLALAAAIAAVFFCSNETLGVQVNLQYENIAITLALHILLLVITPIPYKIYMAIHKRHRAFYTKLEGEK